MLPMSLIWGCGCAFGIFYVYGESYKYSERGLLKSRVDWQQLLLDGGEDLHLELLIPEGDHENIMEEENDFMDL